MPIESLSTPPTAAGHDLAAGLSRVSTPGQADDGLSLSVQDDRCREAVARLGLRYHRTYEDAGVSGDLYQARPALQAALSDMRSGLFSVLVVTDESRLSWSNEHMPRIVREITQAGGRIFLLSLGDYIDPENYYQEFSRTVITAANRLTRQHSAQESRKAKRKQAANGSQPQRSMRPWGYRIVTKADVIRGDARPGTEGTYLIIEEEAIWVRTAFKWFAWDGFSLRAVASRLNDEGVPTMRPERAKGVPHWTCAVLRRIFHNPIYVGAARSCAQRRTKDEYRIGQPTRRGIQGGSAGAVYKSMVACVPAPAAALVTVPAPSIVDTATWDRAASRLATNRSQLSGAPGSRYLLSGLIYCPKCGRRMEAESGCGSPAFRCRSFNDRTAALLGDAAPCCCARFHMPNCEQLVASAIQGALSDSANLANLIRVWQEGETTMTPTATQDPGAGRRMAEVSKLTNRIAALESRRDALLTDEAIDAQFAASTLREISRRHVEARQALSALRAEEEAQGEGDTAAGANVLLGADPQAIARDAASFAVMAEGALLDPSVPLDLRRQAIRGLVDRVVPEPEFTDNQWKRGRVNDLPQSATVYTRPFLAASTSPGSGTEACIVVHVTMAGDYRVLLSTTGGRSVVPTNRREVVHA